MILDSISNGIANENNSFVIVHLLDVVDTLCNSCLERCFNISLKNHALLFFGEEALSSYMHLESFLNQSTLTFIPRTSIFYEHPFKSIKHILEKELY